jgi:hypothetical protein
MKFLDNSTPKNIRPFNEHLWQNFDLFSFNYLKTNNYLYKSEYFKKIKYFDYRYFYNLNQNFNMYYYKNYIYNVKKHYFWENNKKYVNSKIINKISDLSYNLFFINNCDKLYIKKYNYFKKINKNVNNYFNIFENNFFLIIFIFIIFLKI